MVTFGRSWIGVERVQIANMLIDRLLPLRMAGGEMVLYACERVCRAGNGAERSLIADMPENPSINLPDSLARSGRSADPSGSVAKMTKVSWYPVRVLFGKVGLVKRTLDECDVEYFYPTHTVEKETKDGLKYVDEPLVRSLIFIKTTSLGLREIKMRYSTCLIPYYDRSREDGTRPPVTVPEDKMEMFIKLCEMKESGLEYLGEDEPKYHKGDRVRVTDGIFKGFEGHIKRIRHDRKLIVTIEGVAAFATRFIPPSMLEKIEI